MRQQSAAVKMFTAGWGLCGGSTPSIDRDRAQVAQSAQSRTEFIPALPLSQSPGPGFAFPDEPGALLISVLNL
jgi:hypothetical protein